MLKRKATVLALVCAGHAASLCFSLSSLDQLWERFGSTRGSWVVWEHMPKAPTCHLCGTVLPPNLAVPFQLLLLMGRRILTSAGKNCMPGTISSSSSRKLGRLHSDLQICLTPTRLLWNQIVTDLLLFCSWPSLAAFLTAALPGTSQLPFHLPGNTPYPTTQHIQFVIVITSFPSWKDHCNPMCSLWYLAALLRERSRERRVKWASLTARADIFAFCIQFSFPSANAGASQKKFPSYANLSTSRSRLMQCSSLARAVLI